MSVDIIKVFIL